MSGAGPSRAGFSNVPFSLPIVVLPAPVETAAYYVVSEALTNAVKHSRASEVGVAATCHDGLLAVEIADNGAGGAARGTGSGLRGLADRVEALNGR